MKKQKWILLTFTILLALGSLVGCSSNAEETTVKVGISGSDTQVWDFIAKKAEKEGVKIEVVTFSDYVQPNLALADGSIDANAFQTIAYLNQFKNERKLDIKPIGTTVIAPMGIYSKKYKNINDIPNGSTITIPNDLTNGGRALLLLEKAGLIKMKADFNGKGLTESIESNPKNLKIVPVAAPQTPRSMDDAAAAVINNGIAVSAGLSPVNDPIFREDETAKPYINVIAAQTKRANEPALQKLVELYQSEDVHKYIEQIYKGGTIPVVTPVSEIENF
ncbi:MetQ/NlpA family ABC transporter substrate-binding protein [Risungbinella massiliensis]|uniref:MetQ/NlpA family ABC transporter substrate-binding protein n=1 Tax=Risungbinella massiliensis TaxID=1329796 RepID=UPI0005CB9A2D|nr:MetQ/NlpA family ABC transporter substrate-binding protein [Risungbinella massiliensis]